VQTPQPAAAEAEIAHLREQVAGIGLPPPSRLSARVRPGTAARPRPAGPHAGAAAAGTLPHRPPGRPLFTYIVGRTALMQEFVNTSLTRMRTRAANPGILR
jgi:hypothetical protein